MNDRPISDLISRMLQDMTVRQFSEKTQHDYIRHVEVFAKFLGRSPATATGDDLRRFQFQQTQDGAQPPKMNTQASALRFLFGITLGRADLAHQLARTHYPKKLPRILSPDDVALLLEAAPGPGLKYKAALSVAYGAGLRGCEVVMLRVSDIDSKRMLIRVEMGIRRFLTHVLPKGFHRIRHYGLLASGTRAENLATIRILLAMDAPASKGNKGKEDGKTDAAAAPVRLCPCCGGRMLVIETFEGYCRRRRPAPAPAGIDTS